jgi:cytochrome c5
MSQNDDRTFLRRFSGIIFGLVVVTGIIIALAFSLRSTPDPEANPSQMRLTEERIAPVAGVRTGSSGQAELDAIVTTPSTVAPVENGAATAVVDGKKIYDSVCMACHAAGVAGAPIPGSEAMAQRLAAKGPDGLFNSVINGLNVMPPRGGRPDLSDDDIRAAIEFMQQ